MKLILKFICLVIITILSLMLINLILPDKFKNSYERSIVYQYDYYKTLGNNKIVFIGYSPFPFCLDLDVIEKLTNRKCIYLSEAIESGINVLFEISKSNLKEGDIVVITIQHPDLFIPYNPTIFYGFGKRFDLYKYLKSPAIYNPTEKFLYYTYMSKLYLIYLKDLIFSNKKYSGTYSLESFNSKGKFIAQRLDSFTFPNISPDKEFHYTELKNFIWGYNTKLLYKNYVDYCKSKKVKVFFTYVPNLKQSIISSDKELNNFEKEFKREMPAPVISNVRDYIFDKELMFDCPIHCTNEGAKVRAQLLYNDLKPYLK